MLTTAIVWWSRGFVPYSQCCAFVASRHSSLFMASALEAVCSCPCDGTEGNYGPIQARCDCVLCGVLLADGTRRCHIQCHPYLALATPDDLLVAGRIAVYCGNCIDHNIREHELAKERAAATRPRRKRSRARSRSRRSGRTRDCFTCSQWRSRLTGWMLREHLLRENLLDLGVSVSSSSSSNTMKLRSWYEQGFEVLVVEVPRHSNATGPGLMWHLTGL
jgi:hypothetical protein